MDCVTLMRACYMQMSLEQLNTMVCYYLRGCLIPTIQYSMPDVGGGGKVSHNASNRIPFDVLNNYCNSYPCFKKWLHNHL